MTETITTADGRELPVTEDPAAVEGYATRLTLSADEQTNLGNYENYEAYVSARIQLHPAIALGTDDAWDRIENIARVGRARLNAHLREAIEGRVEERADEVTY